MKSFGLDGDGDDQQYLIVIHPLILASDEDDEKSQCIDGIIQIH